MKASGRLLIFALHWLALSPNHIQAADPVEELLRVPELKQRSPVVRDSVQEVLRRGPAGDQRLPGSARAVVQGTELHDVTLLSPSTGIPNTMEFIDRAVRFKGDVERGRALFFAKENDACSRCHTVAGQGRAIGPDLTAIGAKYGRRALVEHIINPSAQIEESFKPVRIQTRNNDPVLGIMKENGDDAFVVLDSDGRQHTLRKEDVVRAERSEFSLMPEVLHLGYSLEGFGDLVAFLATLKGTD